MKKIYEAPELFVDEYAADTMIASSDDWDMPSLGWNTKSGNPDNNQNCWGCRYSFGAADPSASTNACGNVPGDGVYEFFC